MDVSRRVLALVKDIVADHMDGVSTDEISMDSCLIDDLSFDFADEMEFMCKAEVNFGIELPDRPLRNDTTVADLVRLVEQTILETRI